MEIYLISDTKTAALLAKSSLDAPREMWEFRLTQGN